MTPPILPPRKPARSICLLCLISFAVSAILTAQQQAPDAPEPPPPPVTFQNQIPATDLAFIRDFAGQPAKELLKDKRFKQLLKQVIPKSEYHYGRDMPLSEASDAVIGGSKIPILIRDNRYVTISGKQGAYLDGRGFLWFDLQTGTALGGVYFHPTNGEPSPTLAVFSKQLNEQNLSMSQLPLAFAQDLSNWVATSDARWVSPRYFIPANGKKYVLLHDEDFCDHPPNAPAPDQNKCMKLNEEAADADVNAAYFMAETHNAANATAWMLGPDQTAWISLRDQTCGVTLQCRIRLTRQRTRVLIRRR
jgi:uncharacterized protein YecT (DUF1311 family)